MPTVITIWFAIFSNVAIFPTSFVNSLPDGSFCQTSLHIWERPVKESLCNLHMNLR